MTLAYQLRRLTKNYYRQAELIWKKGEFVAIIYDMDYAWMARSAHDPHSQACILDKEACRTLTEADWEEFQKLKG